MKWFKHYANTAVQSTTILQLIEDFGVEGYGRYFLLIESIVSGLDQIESSAEAEFTVKQWSKILRTKIHNVEPFFDRLQSLGLISCTVKVADSLSSYSTSTKQAEANNAAKNNAVVTVALVNSTKILSKSALPSGKRKTLGLPTEDQEQKREIEAKEPKMEKPVSQENKPHLQVVKYKSTSVAPINIKETSEISNLVQGFGVSYDK